MTRKAIPKYQMLLRVRDFGAARRDLFPARSVAGKLFAAVAAAADALQQHDSSELVACGGEQDAAASKVAARAALRRQVRAIARTAAVAETAGLGALGAPGATFRASLDCSDERLLLQARTLLQEAKPFAATFVAHELPSNFLGQLQAAIDAFEGAVRARASGRDQRVAARTRFETSMEAALRAVRRLNAIVPNKLNDPAGIASWSLACRVDYGRVRSSKAATPDAAKPAA
jgi:hypothetical protein